MLALLIVLSAAPSARAEARPDAGASKSCVAPSGDLAKLTRLLLDGCLDGVDPATLAKAKNVVALDLGHNGLREVPAFVRELTALETLDLRGNELKELPDWLARLPKLKKLVVGDNCALLKGKVQVNELSKRFSKLALDITTGPQCDSE